MRALLNDRASPPPSAPQKKAEQRAAKLALRILEAEEKGLTAPAAEIAKSTTTRRSSDSPGFQKGACVARCCSSFGVASPDLRTFNV